MTKEKTAKLYDSRSGEEAEIKEDKRGLHLEEIRKGDFQGQEALILLTQLAHNILVWSRNWFFRGTRIAEFGLVRLMEKVLNIPGEVEIKGGRLKRPLLRYFVEAEKSLPEAISPIGIGGLRWDKGSDWKGWISTFTPFSASESEM